MSKIEVNQISSQCGSTLTIGQSGDTVTLACGATQTGFGRTGTVNWDTTAKTSAFTAVSGNGYFINTTSGAITVTLPATPSAGDIVALQDYAGTWGTNNVTIGRNGSNIGGSAVDGTLSISDQSITLVYVDATRGWQTINDSTQSVQGALYVTATGGTITTCGDYKYHKFTGPGTFCVSCAGTPNGSATIQTLLIAGGGGGGYGSSDYGGGGGAGGLRNISCISVTATGYPITVGGGGAAGQHSGTPSGNGSSSTAISNTSAGGGRGATSDGPAPGASHPSCAGGSGGGGGGFSGTGTGGAGNTPAVAPPQGNPGGNTPASNNGGAGGGGASCAGTPMTLGQANSGFGGAGTNVSACFPAPLGGSPGGYYSGGGGGSTNENCTPTPSSGYTDGGIGGGGRGSSFPTQKGTATAGTANTGGGGGGGVACTPGPESAGGAGGSGIVIIKYKYQN